MVVTIPTIGQTPWGATLNAVLGQALGEVIADDRGLIAWSWDPSLQPGAGNPTTGVLNLTRVQIRRPVTITNLVASVAVAGVTLTAGQNFGALYDSAGTRVGVTADQTAAWGSAGNKTMALTASYLAAQGFYWVALLSNGTTAPQFVRAPTSTSGLNNLGATVATAFSGTFGAAQTTTPASITPGTIALNPVTYFAAVS